MRECIQELCGLESSSVVVGNFRIQRKTGDFSREANRLSASQELCLAELVISS